MNFSSVDVDRRPTALLLLAFALLATSLQAQPLGFLEKAKLEVVADRTAYEPGSTARIAAVVTIEPHWHVNSNQPSDENFIATTWQVKPPEGWPEPVMTYPPGKLLTFSFWDQPLSVYEGEIRILAELQIPADTPPGPIQLRTQLGYQACDDESCLPPIDVDKEVTLTIGPGGQAANALAFEPVDGSADQDSRGDAIAAPTPARSLWSFLFVGLIGGLILNAMPCVLPVLSLKVFGLVRSAGEGRRSVTIGALATAAGILFSFWALALAAIAAKEAGSAAGWGVQFQNPLFVAGLTVVILLFCLNLWGLFEIPLPQALARAGSSGPREGIGGHFVSGLFATLMATPCSAPFLGVAIGFALSQSAVTILAVFTAIGIGMALPYLTLAVFPGAANFLPKPGAWMDTFKGVMGFLLAGAAVWLLYVLAAQIPSEQLAFIQGALLLLSLFVWLRHRGTTAGGKRLALIAAVATIGLILWLPVSASQSDQIDWVEFDQGQAEALARQGRLVFVDVTADWCFTCKVNERLILNTETIAGAVQKYDVVMMRADWTNSNPQIADFLASHGRYGIPFYVLYRPGAEPYVFSEVLTKNSVIKALEAAAKG